MCKLQIDFSRRVSGLTLVEAVSVLTLLVLVVVLLSEITIGALRVFEQSRTEENQRTTAELAFQRMTPRLAQAMAVNTLTASDLDATLPRKDSSGVNDVDYDGLHSGARLRFFRGTGTAGASSTGTYLWESVDGVVKATPVAAGFSNCSFVALTTGTATVGVRITLDFSSTVLGTRTVRATYVQEVSFRNVP